jgi:protein gp37
MGAGRGIGSLEDLASGPGPHGAEAGRARSAPPEWYDLTWNPTAGCSAISPGCDHCQALRTVSQLARMGGKGGARYAGLTTMGPSGLHWTGEIRVRTALLTWPLLQRRPRRILVDPMSDLFHEKLATETIDVLHAVMTIAHWHRFLVLTKRAERMRAYYADPRTPHRIAVEVDTLAATVLPSLCAGPKPSAEGALAAPVATRARPKGARQHWAAGLARIVHRAAGADDTQSRPVGLDPWPLPNLWPGVSVEDQERITRIGDLLQMPAALRWACVEPLLGPVRPDAVPVGDGYVDALGGGRYTLDGRGHMVPIAGPAWRPLDWVVAGGEIGAGARPTDPDWVRGLRDRCVAAGVPFFFKQWGEWAPAGDDRFGQRMVRIGRRAAGRLIDGRSWDETPAPMRNGRARSR